MEEVKNTKHSSCCSGGCKIIDGVILPSYYNPKKTSPWISVKERMPEKSGNYLVYSMSTGICTAWLFKQRVEDFYQIIPFGETDYEEHVSATHWMPLPEQPED